MSQKDVSSTSQAQRHPVTPPRLDERANAAGKIPPVPFLAAAAGANPREINPRRRASFDRTRASLRTARSGQLPDADDSCQNPDAEDGVVRDGRLVGRLRDLLIVGSIGLGMLLAFVLYVGQGRDQPVAGASDDRVQRSILRRGSIEAAGPAGARPFEAATRSGSVIGDRMVAVRSETSVEGEPKASDGTAAAKRWADFQRARVEAAGAPAIEPASPTSTSAPLPVDPITAGDRAEAFDQPQLRPIEREILRDMAQAATTVTRFNGTAGSAQIRSSDRPNQPPKDVRQGRLLQTVNTQALQRGASQSGVEPASHTRAPRTPRRLAAPAEYRERARAIASAEAGTQAGPIYSVQLLSVSFEQAARRAAEAYQQEFDDTLAGLEPMIQRADLPRGTVFRVRAGAFATRAEAEALCTRLKRQGTDCLVFRR